MQFSRIFQDIVSRPLYFFKVIIEIGPFQGKSQNSRTFQAYATLNTQIWLSNSDDNKGIENS